MQENIQRKKLSKKKVGRYPKEIDMEKVYIELDKGKSVQTVAKEFGVSRSTIYRNHEKYQSSLNEQYQKLPPLPEKLFEKKNDEFFKI